MVAVASTASTWLYSIKPRPQAALRLFCLPFAGGGASAYRAWANLLPESIEVCPIQLPGRENRLREPLFTRVGPLVEQLSRAVAPLLDRPFAIFGHSLGALIAFEWVRRLRRDGLPAPLCLFASARLAPHVRDPRPPASLMAADEFLAEVRKLNGTPAAVLASPELLAMLLPIMRADFAVNENYSYYEAPRLDVPLRAFGGSSDPKASRADLEQWGRHTGADFGVQMFAGDHFFITGQAQQVCAALAGELARYG